jgi:arylsulfatase A-like enzyme
VKTHRGEYYAIIEHMDAQVGRILDALKKSGKADSTVLIFTADQGLAVGHHGLMGKQNMFEHSMRSPLFIAGLGIPKSKRITTPVYIQDVMPTTLELAGVEIPEHVQFRSLLPLIDGKRNKNYDAMYGAYIDLQRMVRKDNWKLIYYPKIDKTLLFDLNKDPEEINDLAGDERYAPVVEELRKELRRLQKETGDELEI